MVALDLSALHFRAYAHGDLAAVRALHDRSFAALAPSHYAPAQTAAHGALIAADDYADDLARSHMSLAEAPGVGLVAAAGWIAHGDEAGTARVRKLFIAPAAARQGLGRLMLSRVEAAAQAAGYRQFFLRAYLNAVPFYRAAGYSADAPGVMPLPGGAQMPVLFMRK